MAEKDRTGKEFLEEPDVFASVFNALVFDKESDKITKPFERLRDEPTEGIFVDHTGRINEMIRDVFKSYSDGNRENYLVYMGIEEESSISRVISVRVMGYTYAAIRKQLKQYHEKKDAINAGLREAQEKRNTAKEQKALSALEELGEFRMVPVIIIVLNYGEYVNVPLSIKELADPASPYLEYMEDFRIRVFNVHRFDSETRARFKDDFRIFLELLCTGEVPDTVRKQTIKHPVELFNMVAAYMKDDAVSNVRDMIKGQVFESEDVDMDNVFARMYREFDAEKKAIQDRADAEIAEAESKAAKAENKAVEAENKAVEAECKVAEIFEKAKRDKEELAEKMIKGGRPVSEIMDFTTLTMDKISELSKYLKIPLVTG